MQLFNSVFNQKFANLVPTKTTIKMSNQLCKYFSLFEIYSVCFIEICDTAYLFFECPLKISKHNNTIFGASLIPGSRNGLSKWQILAFLDQKPKLQPCNVNLEHSIGFPQNFYLGFTKNGWMDTKQFYAYITNHFVKKIPPLRPVVLLTDGHGSHIDYYVSQSCAENQILPGIQHWIPTELLSWVYTKWLDGY